MKTALLARIDKLIAEGKRLESSMKMDDTGRDYSDISEFEFRAFATGALAAIDYVTGQSSQFFPKLQDDFATTKLSVPGYGLSPIHTISGALAALRDAVDNDHLVTLEDKLRAAIHDDLLQQAKGLLKAKYHVAAMVLTGSVMENHLRKLCQNRSLAWTGDGSISKYNNLLKDVCYPQPVWRRIQQIGDIRNDAAHDDPTKVKAADVDDSQKYVERLLVDYPS